MNGKVHALSSTREVKVSKELERTSGVDMIFIHMHQGQEQPEKHRINMSDHIVYENVMPAHAASEQPSAFVEAASTRPS